MEEEVFTPIHAPLIVAGSAGFRVGRSYVTESPPTPFGRKHFYKIVLVSGSAQILLW